MKISNWKTHVLVNSDNVSLYPEELEVEKLQATTERGFSINKGTS